VVTIGFFTGEAVATVRFSTREAVAIVKLFMLEVVATNPQAFQKTCSFQLGFTEEKLCK
jgi:hypothetical protein